MEKTHYFKRRQEGDIWHYYKLLDGREPIAYELVSFLGLGPSIHFMELDLNFLGCKTEYDALWEVGTQILAQEYAEAYERATQGDFEIYSQGKRIEVT